MAVPRSSLVARAIPSSAVSTITDKADALIRSGVKVIVFSIGRPDFDTPGHIKDAAKAALDKGMVHYSPNLGIPPMREAVAAYLKRHHGLAYDPENEIMVTAGAQEALMLCMHCTLNPGEEVLVPTPGFLLYYSAAPLVGAKAVPYRLSEKDFRWDGATATDASRVIIVNSPNNPTGTVFSREEIRDIAAFARKNELMVISDEAYDRMVFGNARHHSIAAEPDMKERTLVCGSLSKTFSMTGWRLGYVAAPRAMIANLAKLQQNYMLSANTFVQFGGIAALNGPQDAVEAMLAEFDKRRRILVEGLRGAPKLSFVEPDGAFYLFLNHKETGLEAVDFCRRLLEEAHVACVPGDDFGPLGRWHTRISYATSAENCAEGARRIQKFVRSL